MMSLVSADIYVLCLVCKDSEAPVTSWIQLV